MDINNYPMNERNQIYISGMRPPLDRKALYSDTSPDYVIPPEPNPYSIVKIRFRTGRNHADSVFYVSATEHQLMNKVDSEEEFDYYEIEVQLDDEPIQYSFEIQIGRIDVYYDTRGVVKERDEKYTFRLIPGFKTPDWAKGAVMYQIYIDRFYNGDKRNDVLTNEYSYIGDYSTRVEDWNKYPAMMGVREFYGGDLQGVMEKFDYLQDLGIEAIYFNPLFVSPSNHKYDIQDYDYIDPHIGKIVVDDGELLQPGDHQNKNATRYISRVTRKENLEASNQLFQKLVEEAHKRNIKVIIDGVFNHCGSFNKWMDRECIYENQPGYEKGAYVDEKSPYHSFFKFNGGSFPYNKSYDGWWGHDTLPKLNYEGSQSLQNYILEVARKWVSPPYNVDGWRLDVAADLGHSPEFNHKFWKEFRRVVKQANPEAIIIAEHYGCPKDWLMGKEWDTVMNYDAFMEPVTWFLTGMQKHSDDFRQDLLGNSNSFWGAMKYHSSFFTAPSISVAMNELSNHDHSRFLTRTNKTVGRLNSKGSEAANTDINKAVMRNAVLIQMTWVGAPTIYYGDEAGVCGFTDPDNRRTYPWGNEDHDLINYHKELIRIRKTNKELKLGSTRMLKGEPGVIAYARFTKREQSIIIVNNNDHEVTVELSVWETGIPRETTIKSLMYTTQQGYSIDEIDYAVEGGRFSITMPKESSILLKRESDIKEPEKVKEVPKKWFFN